MRRLATFLVPVVLVIAGCGGDTGLKSPPPSLPSKRVVAHGVELRLAPGWRLAKRNLSPSLVNPREILSVGTFAMQPGGRCAQEPTRAYSEMGPRDGMITVLERPGTAQGFPPRPAQFALHPRSRPFECAPSKLKGQEVVFSDSGRNFYAFVALGAKGPTHQAERILDSFKSTEPGGSGHSGPLARD